MLGGSNRAAVDLLNCMNGDGIAARSQPSESAAVTQSSPVIDFHTHPIFFRAGSSAAETARLRRYAYQLGIIRMVVLGDVLVHGQFPSAEQMQAINDDTARLVREAPDFFIGFCYLNPVLGESAVRKEIERCLGEFRFRGLKLETCCNAQDACMRPVMHEAARLDLPVLQHTWSMTNQADRRQHESDPDDTAALARRYPETKVVMAHLTGIGVRGILAAKGIDNLWVDTSGGVPEAGLVELATQHLGASRILHGSDLPIREPAATITRIRVANIPSAAKQQILHQNAARLLRLESSSVT